MRSIVTRSLTKRPSSRRMVSACMRDLRGHSPAVFTTRDACMSSCTSSSSAASPSYEHLEVGPLAANPLVHCITLNRPSVHNAFDEHLIAEITHAFQHSIPAEARAVLLRGHGPSFSAGADLRWMKKMFNYTKEENEADGRSLFDMVHTIRTCAVPVVGRVHGAALGGGAGLVAACDIAIATKNSKFGFTEAALGLIPSVISPFVMEKIGPSACSRFFLTAERFDAEVAFRYGLVQGIVADESALDTEVHDILAKVTRNSPQATSACKDLIHFVRFADVNAKECRDELARRIADIRVSPEGQEGLGAFLEKRKPKWNVE